MRLCRLLVLLMAMVALAACARQPSRQYMAQQQYIAQQYAAHQHYAAAQRSDLDTLVYGAPAPRDPRRPQQTAAYRPLQPPPGYARPPSYAPPPAYRPPPPAYRPPPAYHRPPAAYYRPPPPPPPRAARYTRYVPMRPLPEFDGPYTLDTGDRLRVVVFGQDNLSNTYLIDAAGTISMPLIGTVTARDQTTAALAASIKSRLAQGFIREPSVAVEVEMYRPFFVLGEVTYPGQYPFVPHMTVENAVAIAGGFTPRASKSKVSVSRKYQGVLGQVTLPLQYKVRPGDVLTVGERWF